MTMTKNLALTLALIFFGLATAASAQTPSIEVTTDNDRAQFAVQGQAQAVHVEVFSPAGELVFEADSAAGQTVQWQMINDRGERVADGVYLATITVTDFLGKRRKRIEQIVVGSETPEKQTQDKQTLAAEASSPYAVGPINGQGTPGRLAKFTGVNAIGNSVMTESTSKVGVNIVPTATLQVNGLQPAPLATNGTPASVLLQTIGGKGGNTTGTSGQSAGAGASISLVAGNGGDGPSGSFGSFPGKGGSITLQPGSGGSAQGAGAKSGNVLLAPSAVGLVGIGTTAPASTLHVVTAGTIAPRLQSNGTTSFAAGWDFYHGTTGKGYVGVPGTGVGALGPGELILYGGTGTKTSLWAGGVRGITILTNGRVGIGTASPTGKLEVVGNDIIAVQGTSTSSFGVRGSSTSSSGVAGYSSSGTAILATSSTGTGVLGKSTSSFGVDGRSESGTGVQGSSSTGYAGDFYGKVKVTGPLTVSSCTGCTISSDQNLKANFFAVNPRSILDKLVGIPLSEWNYKSDSPSVRHVGPMAQEFRSAFQLGADDKHIDMIDANGVTMASIQALYQMMLEKDKEIKQLRTQMAQQQAQLNQVRRTIRRRRLPR
jgi:hypothetical protein